MGKKLLTVFIALTIMLMAGIKVADKTIDNLENEIKRNSTEIANLEGDIKTEKLKVQEKNKAIKEKDSKLNQNQEIINNQEEKLKENRDTINKLKSELEEKQSIINKQKTTIANFKKEKKGSDVQRQSQPKQLVNRGSSANLKSYAMVATSYIALCDTGCSGITATGIDVRNYPSRKIIAVDPNVIPLHSKVRVTLQNGESFIAVAEDTGGDIKGNRIDILVSSYDEAVNFGRQNVKVTVLK